MPSRDEKITSFLTRHNLGKAQLEPLQSDASGRRYFRIDAGQKNLILMDAPKEKGHDVRPFQNITEILRGFGFSAPEILANDVEEGFLLLEDLGHGLYASICSDHPEMEEQLYSAAIDLLVELHTKPCPSLPQYDLGVLKSEAFLVTQWYLSASNPENIENSSLELGASIAEICPNVAPERPVLVMRDYHAENLMWLPERHGLSRVGLLDYQDALAGHPAYDLVSLLEDARRDTSPALQRAMLNRYVEKSGVNRDDFEAAYHFLGAQRNLKIIGIFARLSKRDLNPKYIELIPRVWAHLMRDLTHPICAHLKIWVDENLPEPEQEFLSKLKEPPHG